MIIVERWADEIGACRRTSLSGGWLTCEVAQPYFREVVSDLTPSFIGICDSTTTMDRLGYRGNRAVETLICMIGGD